MEERKQKSLDLTIDEENLTTSIELNFDLISRFDGVPKDIQAQAKKNLNQLLDKRAAERGETHSLGHVHIHERRLQFVWEKIYDQRLPDSILCKVGEAAPTIENFRFRLPDQPGDKNKVLITFDAAPEIISSWRVSFLELILNKELWDQGFQFRVNPAQLEAAWYRAVINGDPISNYEILSSPQNPRFSGRSFLLKVDSIRQQIDLIIGDLAPFKEPFFFNLVEKEIEELTYQLANQPGATGHYRILSNKVKKEIDQALLGHLSIGIEMPLVILAAFSISPWSPHIQQEEDLLTFGEFYGRIQNQAPLLNLDPFTDDFYINQLQWSIPPETYNKIKAKMRGDDLPEKIKPLLASNSSQVMTEYKICGETLDYYTNMAISLAIKAIDDLCSQKRCIQSLMICINENDRTELLEKVQAFTDRIHYRDEPSPHNIYQFNVQCFPLTRIKRQMPDTTTKEKYALEWCNTALREMVGFTDFNAKPEWISSKLIPPLPLKTIEKSIERLKKIGFITYDYQKRKYVQAVTDVQTEETVTGKAAILYQKRMIKLAKLCIIPDTLERRLVFSITKAMEKAHSRQDFKDIYNFLIELMKWADHSKFPDQLYQINIQLYPLLSSEKTVQLI